MTPAEPAQPEDDRLIFHWAPRREISLALPAFLTLSALLHAVTFYFFQISYPQNVTLAPPPAEITLLTAGEASADFMRWLQEEDPALALRPVAATPKVDFRVQYRPSFESPSLQPRLIDTADAPVKIPRGRDVADLLARAPAASPLVQSAPPVRRSVTKVTFTPELEALLPDPLPSLTVPNRSAEILDFTSFYVGILPNGVIGYVFLESSSGDPVMDRLAEEFLTALRYRRGDGRVKWGFATIRWGADAMRATGTTPP
jgi:hypothetical protein